MAEPHWTTYLSLVVALGALWASVRAHQKVGGIKRLDLRLELRNSVSDLHHELQLVDALLPQANRSRTSLAAATGRHHSGGMEVWKAELAQAESEISSIRDGAPALGETFADLSESKLESKLVEVRRLQNTLKGVREKYEDTMTEDRQQASERRMLAQRGTTVTLRG